MRKKAKENPVWICGDCGDLYGRRGCSESSTWHVGFCDLCGDHCAVTEPRDFGGLIDGYKEDLKE